LATELIDLVRRFGKPRVLVLGDVMLDRYVWGDAERISQEAPVILLRADHREERLGGASSVATMLRALEAEVMLAGVVGRDSDGVRVRQIFKDWQIQDSTVLDDASRPTTVKERYMGRAQARHPQQILRVDYENREPLTGEIEKALLDRILSQLDQTDVVLISDYDKGVCTPNLLSQVIIESKKRRLKVIADPIRGSNYSKYHGCSTITPNRLEAGLAIGELIRDNEQALVAARKLQQQLDLEAGIVTLDKDGMAYAHRDGTTTIFPTRPRAVYDITGAGDMVMSMMALAVAAGATYPDAIRLANIAGGLEVEKIGVATITRDEVIQDLLHHGGILNPQRGVASKIQPLHKLVEVLQPHRNQGHKIAFTNGCFDVLHAGHVQYLTDARAQADVLIVALNSDSSIKQLKGPDRPVNPLEARLEVLSGLQAVDYVTVFEESTPLHLIEALKPDVLVKGADYAKEQVVGANFVESYGGKIFLAPLRVGYSTTNLIEKMKSS
jgi:D-beta-D-heptose 7-phosphate kinase / D-beta-D-heptose 1-phosphate adenosyltransferase